MAKVSDKPIMGKCCKTCPFKKTESGAFQNTELACKVIERNFLKSQQICHHPRTVGKKETHRCRGYYDYAFEIYQRMGLEPEKHLENGDN